MTPRQAGALVRYMLATWPKGRKEFGKEETAAMVGHLTELDADEAKAAVDRLARSQKWLPAISDVFDEVAAARTAHLGSAFEAWALVVAEIRRTGYCGDPQLPEAVAKAVRQVGGWVALCESRNSQADRARFLQCYENLIERATATQRLGSLAPSLTGSTRKALTK
jgi:hypothetical protein